MAEVVQRADAIVIGHATEAQNVRVGRSMYTRYRVVVQEDLLNAGHTELSVVVPGGLDRSGPHPLLFSVGDAPVLQQGATVALLLQRGSPIGAHDHRIVGASQGYIELGAAAEAGAEAPASSVARLQRVRARLQTLIAARASAPFGPTANSPAVPGQPAGARLPRGAAPLLAR